MHKEKQSAVESILDLLPQTQCGECGFLGCKPYAEAIASKKAPINLCPPGGIKTLHAIGKLTNQSVTSLEAELSARLTSQSIAYIREEECIGCTKCLQACPVDAIYGAAKQMHVVLSMACTGCTLCVAPCPVDCITMIPIETLTYDKKSARQAYEQKLARGDFKRAGMLALSEKQKNLAATPPPVDRKQFIAEAVARFKGKNAKR